MDTRIIISHDASEDAMGFGPEEKEIYDFDASLTMYEAMLEKKLRYEFENADITIDRGARGNTVNGSHDTDENDVIDTIVADVFGDFDWLVKLPAAWS